MPLFLCNRIEHVKEVAKDINVNAMPRSNLSRRVLARFLTGAVVLGLLFFVTAGTVRYWHAWIFIAILFIPMFFVLLYLLKYDPALLERRMRTREKERQQKLLIKFSTFTTVTAYVIPGLDYRFKWSTVPSTLVVIADIVIFAAYIFFFLVLRENSYAGRVVEVERDQKVISTGPYAFVRHPMYVSVSLLFLFSPIALGSYWAMIAMVPILPVLIFRIKNEERLLMQELSGYEEYTQRVRYRLLPMVW